MKKFSKFLVILILFSFTKAPFAQISNQQIQKRFINIVKEIRSKKYKSAIRLLRKLSIDAPNNLKIKYILAQLYAKVNDYENAAKVYSILLDANQRNPVVLNEMASSCLNMYKIKKAIFFYKEVLKIKSGEPSAIMGLIQSYMLLGKVTGIKKYLDELQNLQTRLPKIEVLFEVMKLRMLLVQYRMADAYKHVENALLRFGESHNAFLFEKFDIMLQFMNLKASNEILNQLRQNGVKTKAYIISRIKLALKYKKMDLAEKFLTRYKKLVGDDFRYYYFKSLTKSENGNKSAAISFLLKSIARNRYYINSYQNLIELYIKQGKLELAEQWTQQYVDIFGQVQGIKFLKVKLLYKIGKTEESIKLLDKILKENEGDLTTYINSAYFLWVEVKDYRKALKLMQKAYELYPENSHIINNLAYFYATVKDPKLRKPKIALKLAKLAVKKTFRLNASYLDTLSAAYFLNGNRKMAIEIQKRVLAMNPENPDFKKNMKKYRRRQ